MFQASKYDLSLFSYTKKGHTFYLLVYVDDIIFPGSSYILIYNLNKKHHDVLSPKQLSALDYFLDIEVEKLLDDTFLLT